MKKHMRQPNVHAKRSALLDRDSPLKANQHLRAISTQDGDEVFESFDILPKAAEALRGHRVSAAGSLCFVAAI